MNDPTDRIFDQALVFGPTTAILYTNNQIAKSIGAALRLECHVRCIMRL